MNSLYIILTNSIGGMGGGQMYTFNKYQFMMSLGYDVEIYSCHEWPIVIPELRRFKSNIFKEFLSSPLVYSSLKVKQILKKITNKARKYDNVIIESNIGHMALWGEILASEIKCKHMVHLLDERNDILVPEEYLEFYLFKLNRKELSGINKESLRLLFRNSDIVNDSNCYFLNSVCQNVVNENSHYDNIVFPKADFNLCTIGRLEKPYVLECARAYSLLAARHISKKFNIIFIGDSQDTNKKLILKLFANNSNVNLHMLGFVYPIPPQLITSMNCCVSSAGSAGVSYRIGVPTITIDCVDLKAIGVLGYTTYNSLNRSTEKPIEILKLLEKVLFEDYLSKFHFKPCVSNPDVGCLNSHIDFLKNSSNTKDYFNVFSLKRSTKDMIKRFFSYLFGDELYSEIQYKRLN